MKIVHMLQIFESYQGEGSLIKAPYDFQDGTITGIKLFMFDTNGQ